MSYCVHASQWRYDSICLEQRHPCIWKLTGRCSPFRPLVQGSRIDFMTILLFTHNIQQSHEVEQPVFGTHVCSGIRVRFRILTACHAKYCLYSVYLLHGFEATPHVFVADPNAAAHRESCEIERISSTCVECENVPQLVLHTGHRSHPLRGEAVVENSWFDLCLTWLFVSHLSLVCSDRSRRALLGRFCFVFSSERRRFHSNRYKKSVPFF